MLLALAIVQFLLLLDECCSTAVKLWWCKGTALICVYKQGLVSSSVAFWCVCVYLCFGGVYLRFFFFFCVLGWVLFCFILVLCANALGLVNVLSAAEVLVCPWGDERYFQQCIVQTLNKWFVPVSSLWSRWLPALIEVKSVSYQMTQWFDSISKPGWVRGRSLYEG